MVMEAFNRDCEAEACNQVDCSPGYPFLRLRVRPSIAFGSVVDWMIHPSFPDAQPHYTQLQWGQTDSNSASDWEDVGLPGEDVFTLTDPEQRAWGHVQRTHYRVKLTTPNSIYYSLPQHTLGDLSPYEWRIMANRMRIWRLQFERTIRGQGGYLLKRKIHGTNPIPSQKILDWQTNEVIDAQNEATFGTEYLGGYYSPVCCNADLDNFVKFEHLAQNRGTVNDASRISGTFLAVPMLDTGDIWVSRASDLRWRIWAVQHIEEINGVPIALKAELRLLPLSHVSYKIQVPSNPS